jgi:hypothetical protein
MKKLLLILIVLPMIGFGQQTYVPDDFFEAYLEANGMGDGVSLNDSVLTANINTVATLSVVSSNISDLTGIEDFTALIDLYCEGNQLTNLNVSGANALTFLTCNDNQLTSLDVSGATALTFLNCNDNQLTGLDVSNNLALEDLFCYNNQLTSLDVSNNLALADLYCYNNQLTSLDLSGATALIYLNCNDNQLTSLDVSGATALTDLDCNGNNLTSLDVSGATALIDFDCKGNNLTTLDLRNGNNTNMNYLFIENNLQLYCINVDNAAYSNTNWTTGSTYFVIDSQHYFSDNCPIGNLNCLDSLLITDVIIDNTNLTINIAIYNGYNSFLNYPYVAFTIDANGDTIQAGNMNLFGAFNYDTTWYNYSISSPSLFPTYPLTSYFVYTSSLTFMSDTCVLTYNSTPTAILYPSYNNEKEIIKITDLIGRESKQTNQLLFYIYDDGTIEKKIIIE